MIEFKIKVKSKYGLHLRQAETIAMFLRQFPFRILLKYKEDTVNAKAALQVYRLTIKEGEEVTYQIEDDEQANQICNFLTNIFESDFLPAEENDETED